MGSWPLKFSRPGCPGHQHCLDTNCFCFTEATSLRMVIVGILTVLQMAERRKHIANVAAKTYELCSYRETSSRQYFAAWVGMHELRSAGSQQTKTVTLQNLFRAKRLSLNDPSPATGCNLWRHPPQAATHGVLSLVEEPAG